MWKLAVIPVVVVFLGCTARSAPSPGAAKAKPAKARANEPEAMSIRPPDMPVAAPAESEAAGDAPSPATGAEVGAQTESHPLIDEPVPPHIERFLLMAQGGPLLVETRLMLDGRPLREAMAHLVDALLADADADGDDRPTWDEIINSPAFKSGRYGNVEANSSTETARMVQLYDVNKNGVLDRDEAPRFLTRNAGGSRPFSLASSNEYRGYNQFDSPTLQLLDANRDGRLDGDEVAAASVRLRSRDADTDDILLPGDVAGNSLQMAPGQMASRRRAAPDAAYAIDAQTSWDALLYSLSELYAFGGSLDAASFSHRPGLFEKLDTNADGELDRDELRRLGEIEPHLLLDVQFGDRDPKPARPSAQNPRPSASSESGPRLSLVAVADDLQVVSTSLTADETRLAVQLPDSELIVFVNDAGGVDYAAQAQGQISLYDANSDGYLVDEELPNGLPGIASSFQALDGNEDGKLYADELTEYLRQRAGAALTQIRARAADQADAVFAALDTDNDGRLETREIEQGPDRLRSLDGNGDAVVSSNEFPGAMAVGFVRGNPQQGDALFVIPAAPNRAGNDSPDWFQQMDFNGDGEISAREFLGDARQFAALDANRDGFLDAHEAPSSP